ncbi:putative hydroxyacylglutathione hydrolase [Lachnellula suecica]|uniref:hydroxyacylglutathione hydrolase n=1 Tax=Lachnellula suecica TaxID=602035 RepID=A0A8T9C1A0_9HELO|nr:putative hydroxyacylglutathione hydrolase [Lachnellula suecica]
MSSPRNLSGKTAIVTGSSRGIGAGIAIDLANRGANVVVNYTSPRGEVAAAGIFKDIEATGSKCAVVQANLALTPDLQKLVDAALAISEHGKIDILVHNAGTGDDSYLADLTEEFYEDQMNVNLKAPIFLTKLALPHIAQGGRIVMITSVSARMGIPQQTVYAGTKAALEGICKVWATELGKKHGITVNCVSPGPVATDMWTECEPDVIAELQPAIDATPAAARVGEVSDIVPIVAFLCSEESRWVTGSVLAFAPFARAMHIRSIPMWTGSSDNYAYLVIDDKTKDAVIIDPANPEEVAPVLKEQISSGKINLTAIVNTHHHWDHAGGNNKLLAHPEFEGKPIIGGKDCEGVTKTPKNGEGFKIGDIAVKALYTPCHTQDSICWFMEDSTGRVVFTGDTLFHGGCGRFFEGSAEEMNTALNKTLVSIPDDTKVYPGHEYTKANVKFAISVLQSEPVKKLHSFAENNKETQGKFTIGDEKQHNVFMRMDDPVIQKATGKTDPIDVMAKLREMKNNFKPPPDQKL